MGDGEEHVPERAEEGLARAAVEAERPPARRRLEPVEQQILHGAAHLHQRAVVSAAGY